VVEVELGDIGKLGELTLGNYSAPLPLEIYEKVEKFISGGAFTNYDFFMTFPWL
jgi:hypothetical protein